MFSGGMPDTDLSSRAGVLLFKGGVGAGPRVEQSELKQGGSGGPHTRRCIHKVVHTQGGAHRRRPMATAGVLLFIARMQENPFGVGVLVWVVGSARQESQHGHQGVEIAG